MDTHKKIREHVSALADGELPTSEIELALAALDAADGHRAWVSYHRIGDVLRAQPTPELSDDFHARLAERLAREPAHGKRVNGAAEPGAKPAVATVS
jgi:sigma-E factor negative regulatory protein RseA